MSSYSSFETFYGAAECPLALRVHRHLDLRVRVHIYSMIGKAVMPGRSGVLDSPATHVAPVTVTVTSASIDRNYYTIDDY